MDCQLGALEFDIAASAGWYSAVASLLAGFAFVAVLLPLDHQASDEDEAASGPGVVVFVCSFFSLVILALSYAVLAGRTGSGVVEGIAAHEQMLFGAMLGLTTLLLLLGLHSVLGSYGRNRTVFEPARGVILVVTSIIGPIVILGQQFSNALDVERYRATEEASAIDCALGGLPVGVLVNLSITLAAMVAVLVLAARRNRLTRRPRALMFVAKSVLVSTAVLLLWSAMVVPVIAVDVVTGRLIEHLVVVATAVGVVAFAAASWASR